MTKQNSPVSSYCTASVLSIAWGIGCAFVVIALFTAYDGILDARTRKNLPSIPSEKIVVTPSGTPLIQQFGTPSPIRTLDADRNPLDSEANELLLQPIQLRDHKFDSWLARRYFDQLDRQRVERMSTAETSTNWFLVLEDVTDGRGQFVGYDAATCLPIGYLGPIGFRQRPIPSADQFEVDLPLLQDWTQPGIVGKYELERFHDEINDGRIGFFGNYPLEKSQILMQSKAGVYLIDFSKRSAHAVLNRNDVISLAIASQLVEYSGFPGGDVLGTQPTHLLKLSFAARTTDSIIFFDPNRREQSEYRLPEQFTQNRLEFYRLEDETLVLLKQVEGSNRELKPGVGEFKVELVRISSAGEILTHQVMTLRYPRGFGHVVDTAAMNIAALAVPGTLPTSVIGIVLWGLVGGPSDPNTWSERFMLYFAVTWPAILIATLISAALCRFVVRRQVEYHLPRNYGWLVFVFLLGLPGYLGYRFHRKWPLKERPPLPVRTGCEVFAA